jgi:hypothetical protein
MFISVDLPQSRGLVFGGPVDLHQVADIEDRRHG